jgi:hypothetical protein
VIPGQPQVQRLFELTGLLDVLQGLQVRHSEVIAHLELNEDELAVLVRR